MTREMLSRIIAAVLLALALAALFGKIDQAKLTQMQTITPQQYYDHAKEILSHSYAFHFISFTMFGVIYVVCVEVIVFVLRRSRRQPTAV